MSRAHLECAAFLALLLLTLIGCGGSGDSASESTTSSTTAEEALTPAENKAEVEPPSIPVEADPDAVYSEWRRKASIVCLRTSRAAHFAHERLSRELKKTTNLTAKSRESAEFLRALAEILTREITDFSRLRTPPAVLEEVEDYLRMESEYRATVREQAQLMEKPTIQYEPRRAESLQIRTKRFVDDGSEARRAMGLRACS